MKEKKGFKRTIGLILILVIVLNIVAMDDSNTYLISGRPVKTIDKWSYENKAISEDHLHLDKNTAYTVSSSVPMDFTSEDKLLIRSSMSDVTVQVDDLTVYEMTMNTDRLPAVNLWHMVPLPKASGGKDISITYQSPYKAFSGLINPVLYGKKCDLSYHIAMTYGPILIMDIFIILIGIILLIIGFLNPKDIYNNTWHLGGFSTLVGLWLISESRMIQMLIGSQLLIGSMAFICLASLPIPFMFYFKKLITSGKKLINGLLAAFYINVLFIVSMEYLDILDFFQTVWITHGLIFIGILTVISLLILERKKGHESAGRHLRAFSILFLFILLEMGRFYFFKSTNVTFFVRIGLLLFILTMAFMTGRDMISFFKKSYKADFYENLAYMDQLTQGPNRTAFERDMEDLFFDENKRQSLRLVILDMNQLKLINDNHGHVTGDEAIKLAYELIKTHFGKLGTTYRIGGDEFACIITESEDQMFIDTKKRFLKAVHDKNHLTDYPFGIAIGSVVCSEESSVNQLMHKADIKMYEFKNTHGIS